MATELSLRDAVNAGPPLAARWATLLWLLAVGTGVVETVIAVGGALADGAGWSGTVAQVAPRVLIYGGLFVVIDRYFRRGQAWSRWLLTFGLGVLGLASLLIGPIQWLVNGADFGSLSWQPGFVAFAAARTLHILAVLGALALTHHPETIHWFRK